MSKEQELTKEISKNQFKLLKHTIDIVCKKSKFYQKKFGKLGFDPKDLKSLDDFKKFPFTTKEDLLNFNNDFLTKPKAQMLRVISSGGTTSSGKFIYLDKRGLENYFVPLLRGYKLAGLVPGRDITGITFDLGLTVAGLVFGVLGFQKYGVMAVPFGADLDPEILLNYIRQIEVNVLYSPTSRMYSLTEKLVASKIDLKSLRIKKIIMGGALLTKEMRVLIEKSWGAEVYSVYSSTEAPRMGSECKFHNGYHLQGEDYLYIEILDEETGQPAKEGEYGEVVITTLRRDCMPLIRYKMNDLVKHTNESCECGLKTRRILPMIERIEERVVFKNFYKLYGYQINSVLAITAGIAPYWQLVVEEEKEKEKITLFVETDKSNGLEKKVAEALSRASVSLSRAIKNGTILPPRVVFVDKNFLKRTPAYGKIKDRIIDKRKEKFY